MNVRALLGFAALGLLACTQDYGQFGFGGGGVGGASTSTTTTTGSAGGTTSSTAASTSSGGGEGGAGGGAGGGATSSTSSSSSGGGMGGAPPDVSVACPDAGNACAIEGNQRCCIRRSNLAEASCQTSSCPGNRITTRCDEPGDCPGQVCCANVFGGAVSSLGCRADCEGDSRTLCNPAAAMPCEGALDCLQDTQLPTGYFSCQ